MPMKTLLKAYRKRLNLSQSQAAERLGVPVRTLQDWELGRSQPRGLGRVALLERIKK